MTYFELCEKVSKYKKPESIHEFCNFAKWYCIYHKLTFNEVNVKEAFKKYRRTVKP